MLLFHMGRPTYRRHFLAHQEYAEIEADAMRSLGSIPSFHGSKPHILEHSRITLIFVFADSHDIVRKFFKYFSFSDLNWFH